ncbi:DNA translocase FtsK [Xanthomonas oryzae]|uniref:DNA translocase FtsK n=1 Tax=Xanthomonas oryzae TaxID=347 RepID=UPI003D9FD9A4
MAASKSDAGTAQAEGKGLSLKQMAAQVDGVKKTDLYRIDPRLISEEEGFNLRDYNDPDVVAQIERFADDYANGRYVPPLIVRTLADGRIVPVEGHLRRRGALLAIERGADIPFVDCTSFKGGDAERVQLMLKSAEGLKLKPLEVAFGYLRLHRMGHSNTKIAEDMGRTPARVEQLLLLATAESDVHAMVREGRVTADVAVEAVRAHGENAGPFLQSKLEEAQAQGQGKAKVTRRTIRGPSLPPKVLSTVIGSVKSVVERLDSGVRRQLAEFESMQPEQLEGKKVEVDAATLLELVRAQGAIEEISVKREKAASNPKAAAAQQTLPVDAPPAGEEAGDDLLPQAEEAVEAVREEGRVSVALVQRRLGIGYNRAARLLESLEARGVVTAADKNGLRRVVEA